MVSLIPFDLGLAYCFCSLGQLIKVVRPAQMDTTIDQLIEYSGGKDDELRDIAGLGRRSIWWLNTSLTLF